MGEWCGNKTERSKIKVYFADLQRQIRIFSV